MDIEKIAESIVTGLNNLDNRITTVEKCAFKYREYQIEIVLNHLREMVQPKRFSGF